MFVFGWLAWLGLAVSLAVHLSTFFPGGASTQWPGWFALHVGVFVVFFPAMLAVARRGLQRDFRWFQGKGLSLLVVAFLYALVNFGLFIARAGDGSPATVDGRRVLQRKGTVLRELSESEYAYRQRLIVRGFSGHWMLFYLFSALALTAPSPRRQL